MKKSPKKVPARQMSVLYPLLGIITVIVTISKFLSFWQNLNGTTLLDILINTVIAALFFSRSFVGVVVLTFALGVGVLASIDRGSPTSIVQIVLLLLLLPLWIEKFSTQSQ
ncbi:hypothetical protein KBC79_01555 [Candidatus Woesebacteria bacterium]|nr:hypothetical protein [Candidatus Woesebacteria bacterium]